MTRAPAASRDYWRAVLLRGGRTTVPRWTLAPATGIGEHQVVIPEEQVTALCRLADEVAVPLSSVLLAAHAKVLAALSGEREVVAGYLPERGESPLPCQVRIGAGSWRTLLAEAGRAESDLLAHQPFPVDELRRELGHTGPAFETVLDPAGEGGELGDDTVLRVGIMPSDGSLLLKLRYRAVVLDADCAARILGYHLTALALIAADPEAPHDSQSLLSAEELRLQIHGLAGPDRELPDARVHELFEWRVKRHPDAVAAVHGDAQLTYRELNTRANRLARGLLARGLCREEIVAVVTERNLDWMAAVLAIWKAGGAYLPLEPHFPAARIATALSRAGCQLVLTEPASRTSLDEALDQLGDVEAVVIEEACTGDQGEGDLGLEVGPDRLAYVLFTSGSTGEPKGVMCEHAGMLNHLYAKIDDLDVAEGETIPQTGPQCFDISVWQLVAALLVGGRTLIVDQEVILDVERFVDAILDHRAGVLQVVPSYLDVVVSYLEQHPRELEDLHCVSPTGDFLKKELVQRWFAAYPGIKLVNTYGLTETSDDAVHACMTQVPAGERVPLGRPINNTTVYVVDDHDRPVPLGAPGLIVFSGVCVGRGYVNDPERTDAVFAEDPLRPGQRICRTGDYGRWLPDGTLDFLGRRDNQVKIRGFRIEIGEVDNALLRVPRIRDGAAVVVEGADRSARLVAFYSGTHELAVDTLRERLGELLPEYMVPSAFHWQPSLPLTANGKIDRRALAALVQELDGAGQDHDAPRTPTEQRLAAAWAKVLGVPEQQIGRHDHFFDRGGTSLSAVKLAVAMERTVSLQDVTRSPVLADLAAVVDGRSERRAGLLHCLSAGKDPGAGALVCFPHAGGNAVNFQPLVTALRGTGLGVYAVELPGHDVAAAQEPFAPLAEVVERVVNEIVERRLTRILLWGQSAGAALAIATARRLQERGVDVQRVFVAGQLLGTATDRRAALARTAELSDAAIGLVLSDEGAYTQLAAPDPQRAQQAAAAYRHDSLWAHRFFLDALGDPASAKVSAPVTVVVAADDPRTAGSGERFADWELLADHVDLLVLPAGGHYFLRTHAGEVAPAVLDAADLFASS